MSKSLLSRPTQPALFPVSDPCRRGRGVSWSSRYRRIGTCVMWQPVHPPAVAPHETGRRLRVRPPAKAVGATRRIGIMQDVVVHQHAALRYAIRHRADIDVDGIPAHGVPLSLENAMPSLPVRSAAYTTMLRSARGAGTTASPKMCWERVNGWRLSTWAQILKKCVKCCKTLNSGQFHLSTKTNGLFPKLGKWERC